MKKATLIPVLVVGLGACANAVQSDRLQKALDGLNHLALLNSLELDAKQIQQLIQYAGAVQKEIQRYENLRSARAQEKADMWRQARSVLVLGQPLPDDLDQEIQAAEKQEVLALEEHVKRVSRNVSAIRSVLYPRQNALINWQAANEREKTAQEKHREATNELALRALALQTIESVRNLPQHQYFFQRLRIAEEFLTPIAAPGTTQFEQLYPIVLDIFRRAREPDYRDYLRVRDALAEELLVRTGLSQPLPAPAQKPISFEMLVEVFRDPLTADALQEMLKARRAAH